VKTLIVLFALIILSGCANGNYFERTFLRGGGLMSNRAADRSQIEAIRKGIESGQISDEKIKELEQRNPYAAVEFEEARHYPEWLKRTCSGYGFKPDTPQFSQCQMQVDLAERQRRATLANEKPSVHIQNSAPEGPTFTNCNPNGLGGVRCTTY
jgi:hypothetical protein